MQPTEPTRGTREFLRRCAGRVAELRAFTKSLGRGERKRKAAIERGKTRTTQ